MSHIFITNLEGEQRFIEWEELNQLKKDILWFFAENTKQLNASFIPKESFKNKYWEYFTLNYNDFFNKEEHQFYVEGVLIITLGMCIEYIDTLSGDQQIFGETSISEIIEYINKFNPSNENQKKLKKLVELGLEIANSLTPEDLISTELNKFEYLHLNNFYSQLNWVDDTFIKTYFRSLL
ncbi:hypothetical protein AD998_09815 [bacterium 336/3]|nr:hypothetical protein AD998_09815 [bacterium 336/3]